MCATAGVKKIQEKYPGERKRVWYYQGLGQNFTSCAKILTVHKELTAEFHVQIDRQRHRTESSDSISILQFLCH